MKRKFYKVSFYVMLVISAALTVFSMKSYRDSQISEVWAKAVADDYSEKSIDLDKRTKEFDDNLQQLQDKYYEEKLTKLLDEEQLTALAKEEWQYSLKVNGKDFNGFYIYPESEDVIVMLTENQQESDRLPVNIHKIGSLTAGDNSDRFYDHLMVESTVPYKRNIEEKGNTVNVYYVFQKVPSGTIIYLTLSEPMRERLKLDYADLEVIMK